MSIYTQAETLHPLSYHYVNNDIDSKQKQLARDRLGASWDTHNFIKESTPQPYVYNGKHYSLRAVK